MGGLEALVSLYRSGRFADVVRQGELLRLKFPREPLLHNLLGGAYLQTGQATKAEECFRASLRLQPQSAMAHNSLGVAQRQSGRAEAAIKSFKRALELDPNFADALINLGAALTDLGKHAEAIDRYQRALRIKPDSVEGHANLGAALRDCGKLEEAVAPLKRAIELRPNDAGAHNNLGVVLRLLGRNDETIACFSRSLKLRPDHADAPYNLGITLADQEHHQEATGFLQRATQIKPDFAEAHNALGAALRRLGRREDAVAAYRSALQTSPNYAEAHNNLGVVLQDLGRTDEAIAAYESALKIKPDYAKAHNNLGAAYQSLGRRQEAIASFKRALEIAPDFSIARVNKMHQQAHICDWSDLSADTAVIPRLGIEGDAVSPFLMLMREDNPARHRIRAERFAAQNFSSQKPAQFSPPSARPERLRIGYFSADFHDHATMYLMARLFELHDRERFSIHAYSYGPDKDDGMRRRVRAAFDGFHDVRGLSDEAIADLARGENVDIAIDLKGYTEGSRSGIFAYRAAPLQVSFLGYPGTMGAPFIDYLIADPTLIPSEQRTHYSESIIYLPHTYQVNDDTRAIAEVTPTREEHGLPEDGLVFCCFNNTYKITPVEFDIWMRLLTRVEDSVLWLLAANPWAEANLKAEAEKRGVDPARLIFAPMAPLPEHLARCRLADLFLDTFDCNAHTTASDALWAGLPLVTKLGQSLIARVAGSVLNAIELPELITHDGQSYEALALDLATNPARLQSIRDKLAANRLIAPLFNTSLFTKHIEAAYDGIYERYLGGDAPSDIVIRDQNRG